MLRGHVSLYKSLFEEDATTRPKPDRKGRNEELLKCRNELIVHRYWYYIKIKGLNYPKTLRQLETAEFFLTQRSIAWIISRNFHIINELKASRPDVSFFRKKYPFINW